MKPTPELDRLLTSVAAELREERGDVLFAYLAVQVGNRDVEVIPVIRCCPGSFRSDASATSRPGPARETSPSLGCDA